VAALIRCVALALGWALAIPVAAEPVPAVSQWQPLIVEASIRFGLPEDWVERVIAAESGGRTTLDGHPIRSPVGAIGLMQLMPATWAELRLRYGLGSDPDDPHDNILAGTAYLRLMYDRFGYPGLFSAYNAGPARYARHLATGTPLPSETRAYLATVTGGRTRPTVRTGGRPTPPLFAIGTAPTHATDALFAVRHEASAQSSGGI
jgi:soluble lytic murein transglycosylase-like protein